LAVVFVALCGHRSAPEVFRVVLEEGGAAAVLFWCFGPDSGVLRWWWKLFLPHCICFYCFSGNWCGEAESFSVCSPSSRLKSGPFSLCWRLVSFCVWSGIVDWWGLVQGWVTGGEVDWWGGRSLVVVWVCSWPWFFVLASSKGLGA
jgi:hypothetical protein